MHESLQMLQAFVTFNIILIIFHQEDLHEVVKVSVKHSLCIRSLMAGTQVLDHLVRMQDIASYLRAPLDLLLLPLQLGLLLLTFLELYVIETRLEDSEGILPVVKLRTGFSILDNDS